jgi:hypothetical protein
MSVYGPTFGDEVIAAGLGALFEIWNSAKRPAAIAAGGECLSRGRTGLRRVPQAIFRTPSPPAEKATAELIAPSRPR